MYTCQNSFFPGHFRQDVLNRTPMLWSGEYLSLTCCRGRKGRIFSFTQLCVAPLWRPLVLTFHWEEVGLSCTFWHLWCSHISAWKWQEKQMSGFFFAFVDFFRPHLCSCFTGVIRLNIVTSGRDRDTTPCLTCSYECESACVRLRQCYFFLKNKTKKPEWILSVSPDFWS